MMKARVETKQAMEERSAGCRIVVVHGGSRDNYQLAVALQEAGILELLVTDLFWPSDAGWAKALFRLLPAGVQVLLQQRSKAELPASRVKSVFFSGLLAHVFDRLPFLPFAWRRSVRRWSDMRLGKVAGRIASRRNAGLVSYSYYGYHAFRAYGRPAVLFQLHPHPLTMRSILQRELTEHPECAASLLQEWELALPEQDLERLVAESQGASQYLAASSFTRRSLVEHGVPADAIHVVPYGIDLQVFHPSADKPARTSTLKMLFVGRINQRKGLSYLLEALRLLRDENIHLTICGRVLDDLSIFSDFEDRVTIRPSVSHADLVRAYQAADLFVFPSVGEGFGQVLLEAMASGLPVLATTNTAATDLVENGVEGFVVEPRRSDLLAEHLRWAAQHREGLAEMGMRARLRAEQFPWKRFRMQTAAILKQLTSAENKQKLRL